MSPADLCRRHSVFFASSRDSLPQSESASSVQREISDESGLSPRQNISARFLGGWAVFFLLYALALILLPHFCQPNYRIDILHQIGIGREWVWGTYMFPGFSTWLVTFVRLATGNALCAPFLTAALLNLASILGVFLLARRFLSWKPAFYASAALSAYWYFNMGSVMYNNNGAMTLFWIYAIYFFHRALTERRTIFWILTGLALGFGMISKYPTIILVLAILGYMAWNRTARRQWKTAGPYLSTLAAFIVFLPNFLFTLQHRPEILAYINDKKVDADSFFLFEFIAGWGVQLLIFSPVLIALWPMLSFRRGRMEKKTPQTEFGDYIPFMTFAPIFIQMMLQCVTQVAFAQNSYGYQLWPLAAVALLTLFSGKADSAAFKRTTALILIFTAVELLSLPIQTIPKQLFSDRPSIRYFPGRELAAETDRIWAARYPQVRCPSVSAAGESLEWHAGVYSRFEPTVNAPALGAWSSDKEARAAGGIVLWPITDESPNMSGQTVPDSIQKRFPEALFAEEITLHWHLRSPNAPLIRVGIGVLPPQNVSSVHPLSSDKR